jgi:hypothetical protein
MSAIVLFIKFLSIVNLVISTHISASYRKALSEKQNFDLTELYKDGEDEELYF